MPLPSLKDVGTLVKKGIEMLPSGALLREFLPKPKGEPMRFEVGEGLSPEQQNLAQEKIKQLATTGKTFPSSLDKPMETEDAWRINLALLEKKRRGVTLTPYDLAAGEEAGKTLEDAMTSAVFGFFTPQKKVAEKVVKEVIEPTIKRVAGKVAPKELKPLAQEARKYKTMEEFVKAFQGEIKHGEYWHITDDPNFKISPKLGPRDLSSLARGEMDKGKLMVTSDIEYWNAEFPNRKFAAKLDFSAVKPEDYYQVNRGFGNEFFVKDPSKVRVEKVIPIEQAIKEHQQFQKVLEKNITSKSQLADFYNQAVKVAKEAGEVAPRVIDEALQPLAQEARKYKTAEEFLKVNPIKESKVSQLVYHGSPNQFETFDIKFMGKQGRTEGSGFYFTDGKDIAQGYAREEGGKLFEVYLDIKKPMSLEQRKITSKQLNDVLEEVLKKDREALGNYGGDINSIGKENTKKIARDILETNETDVDLISDMINSGILPPQEINDIFRKVTGYDGIITRWPANQGEKPVNLFIALSPDQIKTKSQLTDFYTQAVKGEIKPKVISAERMAGLKKIFTEVNEKVKLKEPQITIKPIKTIADEAIKFVKENPNSSLVAKKFRNPRTKELESGPLLFRRIGESIRNGELNLEELPKIVTKYGLSANETARLFEDAATYSG